MTTNHVTVATEIQAEIANTINRCSIEVAKLLAEIAKAVTWATQKQNDTMSITQNVQTIATHSASLVKIQTRLDMALEMANMLDLTEAQLEIAVTPVRAWFHTEA